VLRLDGATDLGEVAAEIVCGVEATACEVVSEAELITE
jgi:hypothetical protein